MMLSILVAMKSSLNALEFGCGGAEHRPAEKFDLDGFYRKFKCFAAVKTFISFALWRSPAYAELA